MTNANKVNEMIELTTEVANALLSVGERYSWMDDSWPDMEEDMEVCLSDDFGIDDDEATLYVEHFINNLHNYR